MYAPFYARYAKINNKPEIFDELKSQYEYIRNNMFDENKKLYYHGHDSTKSVFWANSETGNSKSFWLRSIGWFVVSLTDVIEYFPESDNKEYLKGLLAEALEGVLQYQDSKTKMFYQVVDLGKTKIRVKASYFETVKNSTYMVNGKYVDKDIENYLESSGSSMISYALSKASRLGYISSNYKEIGLKIFENIYNHSFKNNELNNICITAGLGTNDDQYKDGSPSYYLAERVGSNDAKGVGPFIMAYLEYRKAGV
jgi:unsaturated rhamnogalacturonyl hydrolase